MRLKLVPKETSFDFFRKLRLWLGLSSLFLFISLGSVLTQSLNFGIDFLGGTTIRTQSTQAVDVASYREALSFLELGDISISEVFDPNFDDNQNLAIGAVLVYIWLRFEWQFAQGAVAALIHDVLLTIGIFSVFQIKFDLAIIAALLTIVGYSLNDTVVVFDRVRENLRKYKKPPLKEILNLSINETLSRTVATSLTTLLALIALFVLGGDVIRGFVFAMIWGVIVGTYSSIFIASSTLLWLGVKRNWSKPNAETGTQIPQE